MDVDEFERRLKKFANPESGDVINEAQLKESFSDSIALRDIVHEGSLARQLMLHDSLKTRSKKA